MPTPERSRLLAFLLNVIPGLGFLYWNRRLAAFIYFCLIVSGMGGGVFLSLVSGSQDYFIVALVGLFLLWCLCMLHMLIVLLTYKPESAMNQHIPYYGAPYPVGAGSEYGPHIADEMRHTANDQERVQGAQPLPLSPPYPHNHRGMDHERLITILLSFVPGLGHFHLGLMQRGLSFLLAFFGLGAMLLFIDSLMAYTDGFLAFLVLMPVIWLYSMFDAVKLVHMKLSGEVLNDQTVFEDLNQGRRDGKRSKILAMILSVLPGAGHMYLGLQKRGLHLMVLFLGGIYVLDVLRLSVFLFLIPIVWCYSFFDSLQLISRYGSEKLEDRPIFEGWQLYRHWIGAALLLLGLYYILTNAVVPSLDIRFPEWRLSDRIDRHLKTLIVSILLIVGGIKLLQKQSGGSTDKPRRTSSR